MPELTIIPGSKSTYIIAVLICTSEKLTKFIYRFLLNIQLIVCLNQPQLPQAMNQSQYTNQQREPPDDYVYV